jgi:23S rRNA A1618 N6-methylase RlmF
MDQSCFEYGTVDCCCYFLAGWGSRRFSDFGGKIIWYSCKRGRKNFVNSIFGENCMILHHDCYWISK